MGKRLYEAYLCPNPVGATGYTESVGAKLCFSVLDYSWVNGLRNNEIALWL